jgi:hypothetical protein
MALPQPIPGRGSLAGYGLSGIVFHKKFARNARRRSQGEDSDRFSARERYVRFPSPAPQSLASQSAPSPACLSCVHDEGWAPKLLPEDRAQSSREPGGKPRTFGRPNMTIKSLVRALLDRVSPR